MKKVSIVTVNFNQPKVTEDLLKSLKEVNTYPDLEIIVVDNGSKSDPVPVWPETWPDNGTVQGLSRIRWRSASVG